MVHEESTLTTFGNQNGQPRKVFQPQCMPLSACNQNFRTNDHLGKDVEAPK